MKLQKRILTSIVTASLLLTINISPIKASETVEYLRVGLCYGSTAVTKYTLNSESGLAQKAIENLLRI